MNDVALASELSRIADALERIARQLEAGPQYKDDPTQYKTIYDVLLASMRRST